ncbi:MAG: IPT/TIG domain-containing protein [Myxococcaceae bacterium]|nr:IPT/TIG domain-containing protein [Myxococcaceae bacterium]
MRRALLLGVLVCVACTDAKFAPETLVKDLRVLSIQAEPPEVGPGEVSRLSVLKSDAAPGVPTSVIWVGCEPDPQDLGQSACNDAEILLRPTQITDYPPGLQLLGFGLSAGYRSTNAVFDVLPPADPVRQGGSVGQVLSLVIGEDVDPLATGDKLRGYFERIEQKVTPVVVALTRVLVSEKPPAERNRNPGIVSLSIEGARHPRSGRVGVLPGQRVSLGVTVPDDVRQTYTVKLSTGDVTRTEKVVGAWYSSHGRFSAERFDTETGETVSFIAPGSMEFPEDPVPERRQGTLWLVVRDDRGGQSFERYPFFVCDPALPNPVVQSITPPATPDGQVVVTGENLSGVLDVVVGDAALARGAFSQASQTYLGDAPSLPSGSYPVTVRGRNCGEQTTTLRYVVP